MYVIWNILLQHYIYGISITAAGVGI